MTGKPENNRGLTTLGAIPSNVDRGRRTALSHDKTLFGDHVDPHDAMKGLKREFLFPPFSVLNTRDGLWQARKRTWLKLGIQSELGRGEGGDDPEYNGKKAKTFNTNGTVPFAHPSQNNIGNGISIFDPVLCELMYRWFCSPGGNVLDPFAGGSVRGITAAVLGRNYLGVELSARQVEANRSQTGLIGGNTKTPPVWFHGDSVRIKKVVPPGYRADMVFSCPPYANLEVYSNDPLDISNMTYLDFLLAYRQIIRRSCSLLNDNRFAVWVIGEVRDTKQPGSPYLGLVQDTITAFRDAGMAYYNEMILVTSIGSLPLRTRKAFHASRKVGRTHQTILVFVKGDPKKGSFPFD